MPDKRDRPASSDPQEAMRKLTKDLADIGPFDPSAANQDDEMLSLIVDEALRGVDIATRYPTFYRRLLSDPDLRQAFLDALELLEEDTRGELVTLPEEAHSNLVFLKNLPGKPETRSDQSAWQLAWQRTVEQLQAIFSPPALDYRSGTDETGARWFSLLREDVEAGQAQMAILLECTPLQDGLHVYLHLAVTAESPEQKTFPIQANLQWGKYETILSIHKEGRFRFPNVPYAEILDKQDRLIGNGLRLLIEKST